MKQPSVITITKLANGSYAVDARGAFGGGYTQPTPAANLPGAIIRAWQMYSNNPLGCEIIAAGLPDEAQRVVDKLQGDGGGYRFVLRLNEAEADIVRQRAEAEGLSLNEWTRRKVIT